MKRLIAMLCVVVLTGCGTAARKPDAKPAPPGKEQESKENGTGGRAAKGAAGGAAMGALTCLSFAPVGLGAGGIGVLVTAGISLVCLPFGIVGGAVIGGTVAAAKSPDRPGAPPQAQSAAAPHAAVGEPTWRLIGKVGRTESLPEGTLHVAGTARDKAPVRLLIDLEQPTDKAERSYVGYGWVDCDRDTIAVFLSETYSEGGGNGWQVARTALDPHVSLGKGQAGMEEVLKHLCASTTAGQ